MYLTVKTTLANQYYDEITKVRVTVGVLSGLVVHIPAEGQQ